MTIERTRVVRPEAAPTQDIHLTLGRLPELALSITFGLLLVCLAYAGSRNGQAWAEAAFWAGQLTLFVPVVVRMLSPSLRDEREIVGLVLLLAAAYYAAKFCYAPFFFAFNDEFQHWRTAENMLITKHLFEYNYGLPISPLYPGLQAVTTAVVQLTGLSIFHASLFVMAATRLLLTTGLYLLFRQVSGSARVAGLASVLYTTTFYYKSILAMFIYGNMAIPLLVLVVYGAVRLTTGPRLEVPRRAWALLVLLLAATVLTHHLTSYILVLTLGLGGVVHLLRRHFQDGLRLLVLATVGMAMIAAWLIFVAPQTVGYLQPALNHLIEGIVETSAGQTPKYGGLLRSPLLDRAMSYTGVIVIALCLPLGWWQIWRTQRHVPWALAMLLGSVGFYTVPVIRLVSASGTEHAARALNYFFVPIAYVLAVGAIGLFEGVRRIEGVRRLLTVIAATTSMTLIMAGGITSGWPQYWERLPPGRFLVSGYESGVSPNGLAAAYWSQEWLRGGSRIAADLNNQTLIGPIGQHEMVRGISSLYYDSELSGEDRWLITKASVDYVVVDLRLSQQSPASGEYFADDPNSYHYAYPFPIHVLLKYDRADGAQRILDGGDIKIYDVKGVRNAQ